MIPYLLLSSPDAEGASFAISKFQKMAATQTIAFPSYPGITTTIQVAGKPIKVHAVSTGTVAVKRNFMTRRGPGIFSKVNIILDSHYTEYLPIWVWIIDHPDGVIMVDTGEIDAVNNADHLAGENPITRFINNSICRFGVDAKDNLDLKLSEIGIRAEAVKLIAFTHLHLDHTDGIRFFPKAEFIVSEYEYKHPYSNLPSTYPSWFRPNRVNYRKGQIEIFDSAHAITGDGRILYIPTPGHTRGHSSVVLRGDEYDLIFAGDTSYTQGQVLQDELAGANIDYTLTRQTYAKLMQYASGRKSIYLPSHDPAAGDRLRDKLFLV